LNLRKELDDRLQAAGLQLEWQDVIGDLDRLVQITVDSDGRRFVLRNQTPGCAGAVPRLSASPCRLCSVASMARSPTTRRPPNLASAASPPAAVVPREKTKRDSANPINKLHKHGVKVELSSLSNVYIV
jgi:hypothetical protein